MSKNQIIYAWCEKCKEESEIENDDYGPDWICPKCKQKGAELFFGGGEK